MPSLYKVLGQAAPLAVTNTELYAVPAITQAVCSTLCIANRGITATYRVAVRPAGAALTDKHYIIYDGILNQFDSAFITIGITLATTDVVTVYASTATLSFSLFGTEVTA